MQRRFIVIEGIEGVGKSSAVEAVAARLEGEVVRVREPGGTPLAERLRAIVKEGAGDEAISPQTELLLMYAARSQLVETVIRPALDRGAWVVADRHDLSTLAYQGGGRGVGEAAIAALRLAVLGDFRPGLTLLLDADPDTAADRVRGRGAPDRIESEAREFFARVRARYLEAALSDPSIVVVDAARPIEEVHARLGVEVDRYLAPRRLGLAWRGILRPGQWRATTLAWNFSTGLSYRLFRNLMWSPRPEASRVRGARIAMATGNAVGVACLAFPSLAALISRLLGLR